MDAPSRFVRIDITVTADDIEPAQFQHIVDLADRGCIMMNTLRDKLDVQLRIGTSEATEV
jgi:organic hydroperoxide reductase OsmC/OhrA